MEYLICPNCGSIRFYVEDPDGNLIFFQVNSEKMAVSDDPKKTPPANLSEKTIFCISCAWSGNVADLKK